MVGEQQQAERGVMLIRATLAAAVATFGLIIIAPTAANAGGTCDPTQDPWCQVEGSGPGGGGGGGGGGGSGGSGGCSWNGVPLPCSDPSLGFYIGDGCYLKKAEPPPFPPLPGHDTGGWYVKSCYTAPGSDQVNVVAEWVDDPPAGPTPEQLAQEALAKIHLLGARIGLAPDPNGSGLVGEPVWMWTAVTPGTWGPQSASASGGAITVNLTAKAQKIVWDMGDGHSVTCDNPGTAYSPSYGEKDSPNCGYRYPRASTSTSNPHGRYHITATTYWTVTWNGGGETGVLTPTSVSNSSVEIQELQVVTQ
jgi:hypothetical protein